MSRDASSALVALLGRPNVGKSTLFNRLSRSRDALVVDEPGMTRDRRYGTARVVDGRGVKRLFRIVDTGGFDSTDRRRMPVLIREQALVALEEADVVVLVADAGEGLLPDDLEMAERIRKAGTPVVAAINKAEGKAGQSNVPEFHALGLDVIAVSALHGLGVRDLILSVLALLPEETEVSEQPAEEPADSAEPLDGEHAPADGTDSLPETPEPSSEETTELATEETPEPPPEVNSGPIRTAIIGRPNAGKSSLINRLLGEARMVASEIAGTTRDSVDVPFEDSEGRPFLLVDTAGIRRKSRVSERQEKFSIMAALQAMRRSDVAILVLDASEGVTDQDKRVAGLAEEAGCGLVIAVNKWDLKPRGRQTIRRFQTELELAFPRLGYVPVCFVSAQTGWRVKQLPGEVARVRKAGAFRVPTSALNNWLHDALAAHSPPRAEGGRRPVKIRFVTQTGVSLPTFIFFVNRAGSIAESYRRYLENSLRKAFGFTGNPIRIRFRHGKNPFVKDQDKN
ncbi:MAG: ribosome biogenesis GTPase Der [Magnetococcales bacterium]|nr:ribosome biogenesis GTPase Der [Magnetococcales bacterium]